MDNHGKSQCLNCHLLRFELNKKCFSVVLMEDFNKLEILMKKLVAGVICLIYFGAGFSLVGPSGTAFAAVAGKSFSIVYSSDERGAVTPCG